VVAALLTWGLAKGWLEKTKPAGRLAIALLSLGYEGPPENSWLKDLVPKGVGDSLRAYSGVEVVAFASSRTFDPGEDPRAVAAQLAVDAVVRGSIRVRDQVVDTDLQTWSPDGHEMPGVQSQVPVATVFEQNDALARQLLAALKFRATRPPTPPHKPDALGAYLKGQSFLEGWDVERNDVKAEEAFTAALRIDDDFAEAHAGLAAALWRRYQQTGDASLVDRALKESQRAVSLAPLLPEAHLAHGVILLGRGRSAEAANAFDAARKLAPADDAACRQMARAYYSLKRKDEAEKLFQQAIDLRPSYWENYNAKASFYLRTGKHAEAKELYAKVIELRPLSIAAYNNKATVHLLDGEFPQAEALLRAALQLGPSPDVHSNLGFALYAQGRFEEAAGEYEAAIRAGPVQAETYGSLGDAYRQGGRLPEARAAYEKAIEQAESRLRVNAEDAVLRSGLAMFLAGSGRCGSATREAARVVEAPRVEATAHYYAAVAFVLCGDRVRAVRQTLAALDGGAVADVRTNPDLRSVRTDPAVARRLKEGAIP
jgi:Flp pilus assembly protein TadD